MLENEIIIEDMKLSEEFHLQNDVLFNWKGNKKWFKFPASNISFDEIGEVLHDAANEEGYLSDVVEIRRRYDDLSKLEAQIITEEYGNWIGNLKEMMTSKEFNEYFEIEKNN